MEVFRIIISLSAICVAYTPSDPVGHGDTAAIDVVAGSGNCGGLASIQMRRPVRSSFVLCCSDVALAYSFYLREKKSRPA